MCAYVYAYVCESVNTHVNYTCILQAATSIATHVACDLDMCEMRVYVCYSGNAGCRRCIGRLKLQISFCKRATNYSTLLRKLTRKHKASYGSLPPFIHKIYMHTTDTFICSNKYTYFRKLFIRTKRNAFSHIIYTQQANFRTRFTHILLHTYYTHTFSTLFIHNRHISADY